MVPDQGDRQHLRHACHEGNYSIAHMLRRREPMKEKPRERPLPRDR
jgi:hypothetical protein